MNDILVDGYKKSRLNYDHCAFARITPRSNFMLYISNDLSILQEFNFAVDTISGVVSDGEKSETHVCPTFEDIVPISQT